MKTLGIDVGKTSGWYFDGESGEMSFLTLEKYYQDIMHLVDLYKPEMVVSARPTRMYNVIVFQTKLLAIIELICEKKNIKHNLRLIDSSCKKKVIGKGNAKKPEIMEWAGVGSEHEADAKMFVEYIKKP